MALRANRDIEKTRIGCDIASPNIDYATMAKAYGVYSSGLRSGFADLEALLMLREEFRGFFVACSQGNGVDAAERLNELLIRFPVHPQLSGHDGQPWHVHYTESGSMSDKYAAGAAMGLAVRLAELGLGRFGVCQAAPCSGVFVDTSVNRTRRYCSDRCASRANVIAYRARKRGEEAEA